MENLFVIFITVLLINNFVFVKFLGLCPFLGVSKDLKSASCMGLAVIFVMSMASVVTWCVTIYILVPYDVTYLKTIVFILVISTLVQFVELFISMVSPTLQRVLGIYLPLITTNCAVLGVCILNVQEGFNLLETIVHGFSAGLGFTLAICMMAGIRQRLEFSKIPVSMQGFPISLIVASLMALSFFGFQGFFIIS